MKVGMAVSYKVEIMKSRRKGKLVMKSHAQTRLTEERVGGDTRLKRRRRGGLLGSLL